MRPPLSFLVLLWLWIGTAVWAQPRDGRPGLDLPSLSEALAPDGYWVEAEPGGAASAAAVLAILASVRRPVPRWVKWGAIGAGAGAVTFAALGRLTIDSEPNPVHEDAAVGAVVGGLTIGGSVAFYDWVCRPASWSRRNGLCGR